MKKKIRNIINVCSDKSYSILEIISAFNKFFKKKITINYAPPRPNEIVISDCNVDHLNKILKYKFKHSSIKNLIKTSFLFYKKRKKIY